MEKETMTDSIKTLCVYCGSKAGVNPAYVAAAEEMGREMVSPC